MPLLTIPICNQGTIFLVDESHRKANTSKQFHFILYSKLHWSSVFLIVSCTFPLVLLCFCCYCFFRGFFLNTKELTTNMLSGHIRLEVRCDALERMLTQASVHGMLLPDLLPYLLDGVMNCVKVVPLL